MWKNADVPRSDVPPANHTLVLQSPSTPGKVDMWKNADVPRSDVPPTNSNLVLQSPTTPRSVSYVEACRCTQVRCTPQ